MYLDYLIKNIEGLFNIYRRVNLYKFKNLLIGLLKPISYYHRENYHTFNVYEELLKLIDSKLEKLIKYQKKDFVKYVTNKKIRDNDVENIIYKKML